MKTGVLKRVYFPISSFIRNMLDLNDISRKEMNYSNIDVLYANDYKEADNIANLYKKRNYHFITLTPSRYKGNSIDHYAMNQNSHEVIGQEFDNVVVILDDNFRHSDEGKLQGRIHPNPDYIFYKLLYQNISRAREKLCIIVLDNPQLFENLLYIKSGEKRKKK